MAMANQELHDLARRYREYKRLEEEAKLVKESIRDEIIEYLDDIGEYKVIVGEYKISLSKSSRTDLQRKELEAAHPEVFNAIVVNFLKKTEFPRLLVN